MSKQRWIKLYSGLMESAVWSDPLRLKAWIYILLNANYKSKDWFKNGQVVKVKRGQFVTSIRKLAIAWGCSRETTRRILKQLQDLHMIRYECVTLRYTLVTVIKYEVFQDGNAVGCDSDKDSDKDSDTTQLRIIKNNKKENKSKEPTPPAPPDVGPDGYGEIPDGWTEQDEKEFQMMYEDNDWKTRKKWAEHWKE